MAAPLIEVRRVVKTFVGEATELTALDEVSFDVEEGTFVSIVGPSGCGKSTLLQIIAGLMGCTRGEVRVQGQQMLAPRPTLVGIVFQEALLLPWKTALANVEFPLELCADPRQARRERALELLETVGVADFAQSYPHELSLGMRQRVAIARGLARDPAILLMDEPFAALDEQTRTRMGKEMLDIWEASGKTIVFITHSLSEAVYLSDAVVVMSPRPGQVLARLPVELPRPRTFQMMGSPALGRLRNRIWDLIGEAGA